jgi:hypothetical protein
VFIRGWCGYLILASAFLVVVVVALPVSVLPPDVSPVEGAEIEFIFPTTVMWRGCCCCWLKRIFYLFQFEDVRRRKVNGFFIELNFSLLFCTENRFFALVSNRRKR